MKQPVEESNEEYRSKTNKLIQKVSNQLEGTKTNQYCNFIDSNQAAERYNVDQVIKTSQLLKELEETDTKALKKMYNYKLINMLEEQETVWDVVAEFHNANNDPVNFQFKMMEKGNYKRFREKQKKKIGK